MKMWIMTDDDIIHVMMLISCYKSISRFLFVTIWIGKCTMQFVLVSSS